MGARFTFHARRLTPSFPSRISGIAGGLLFFGSWGCGFGDSLCGGLCGESLLARCALFGGGGFLRFGSGAARGDDSFIDRRLFAQRLERFLLGLGGELDAILKAGIFIRCHWCSILIARRWFKCHRWSGRVNLLRACGKRGESVILTSRGKAVSKISPSEIERRGEDVASLLEFVEKQTILVSVLWTREALHE
jgi:antitoxin (DNA-binding transcriptional repressor) of toxin-antitoxin stability system